MTLLERINGPEDLKDLTQEQLSLLAAEMLTDLGVQPIMADASRALHERIAAEGQAASARTG